MYLSENGQEETEPEKHKIFSLTFNHNSAQEKKKIHKGIISAKNLVNEEPVCSGRDVDERSDCSECPWDNAIHEDEEFQDDVEQDGWSEDLIDHPIEQFTGNPGVVHGLLVGSNELAYFQLFWDENFLVG
ncbi:hypothetical protein QAD02_021759 [Eretmocerus hayati]|uniref:Uncharacterized protein n=1 Tax=Eretmocerus hayati TaxID=131215 RepID=A0ACC2PSP2_9HYME|nr:hypothetical protein QAD02_021759 [Eretmocerus hayati]